MKKNLFLIAMLALAIIFLSACGSGKSDENQNDSDGTTVSDEDTTEPTDTGSTEPTDTGDTEPDGDTGEPEPDGDTTEPETDGDTTEPETDGDTTEPETDGDTTEPETDGDTTEPETDGDTAGDDGEPETDSDNEGTEPDDAELPGTDGDTVEPATDTDTTEPESDSDSEIPSLGCMANSDCNPGEICSHNICVEPDPCEGVECGNGGVCTVESGAAKCNCTSGYYDNNTSCTEITGASVAGWVGIQWPASIASDAADKKVYGQIYVEGQTGSEVPQHAEWKAQLLYKEGTGSAEYPVIAGTWNKVDAVFNSGHSGDNNHEYMADFPTNAAGSFIYIFRFSLDNGVSWWYADTTPAIITSATNTPGQATIN